ncbi:stage III sporulation protein AE [Carboxydothermus pertinax]|uniref:Stage III sporulation protein AE n=1 Tax=Carboxydothermus pertinax TaxID=870242 RepID=A0A1L8CTW0_9THEO|nr:stage III sporulation protein AE [Carboxydothermus pertinax]GAV22375.1 stage III sporulation protein AE [Carboxydothermus pertinax]
MKKINLIIFTLLFLSLSKIPVLAQEINLPDEALKILNSAEGELQKVAPQVDLKKEVLALFRGEKKISPKDLLLNLEKVIFQELRVNLKLLLKLFILAIILSLLRQLENSFSSGSIAQISKAACYLAFMLLALQSFTVAVKVGREAVEDMVGVALALLPASLGLVAAAGAVTTSSLLSPTLLGLIGVMGSIIQNFIFPLLYLSILLEITTGISDRFSLDKLIKFAQQLSMGLVGLMLSLLLGVGTLETIAGGVADTFVLKTARFATGTFIPVVGKVLTDAIEAVAGTVYLLKNALNAVGIVVLFGVVTAPAIKVLALGIAYKFAGAVLEPLGEDNYVKTLTGMGNALLLIFGVLAILSLFLFFLFAVLIFAGKPV